jgi:hypothetical protein
MIKDKEQGCKYREDLHIKVLFKMAKDMVLEY